MTDLSILLQAKVALFYAFAPSKVWQAWCHDMKRHSIGALLERNQHLLDFNVRAWPAMDEEKWNCVSRRPGFLMHIMYVELWKAVCFDGSVEVGKSIEFSFLGAPVESILPVLGETFDVC